MREQKKLISIIIPVHNSAEFLSECIESVINQKYKNIEIIIVDDKSDDDSLKIIKEYAKNDPRIKFLSVKNHNAAFTRRDGVMQSSGDLICFVDSDDFIDPEYISYLYKLMEEKGVDVSACGLDTFENELNPKKINKDEKVIEGNLGRVFCDFNSVEKTGSVVIQSMNTKLYKKYVLENINYSVIKTNALEDNFVMIQILKNIKNQKIAISNKILYHYRTGHGSIMTNALKSKIKFGKKEITYIDLIDEAMKFVEKTYADDPEIKNFTNLVRNREYFDISKMLLAENEELFKILDFKDYQVNDLDKKMADLKNELNLIKKSYLYKAARRANNIKRSLKKSK